MNNYFLLKALFVLLLILSFSGCFTKKQDFQIYRFPITAHTNSISIKTGGFYAPASGKARILFLYENGMIKEGPWVSDFFSQTSKHLEIIHKDYYTHRTGEFFGCFKIYDDDIIFQLFNFHSSHNPIYRRWVFESRGNILSDSSFVLHTNFEHLNNHEFYKQPVLFRFVPFMTKPDSTKAWFTNKRWYRRDLHESRR